MLRLLLFVSWCDIMLVSCCLLLSVVLFVVYVLVAGVLFVGFVCVVVCC